MLVEIRAAVAELRAADVDAFVFVESAASAEVSADAADAAAALATR